MPATADAGSRQDHLFLVLDTFLADYRAWQEGPENTLSEKDPFWKTTEELIELFNDGDLPGRLRTAAATVEALGREWAEFLDRLDQYGDSKLLPNGKFWKLCDTLRAQREEAEPKRHFVLEPIHGPTGLLAQKVPYKQICLIYGWMDDRGNPELWKLQEEIKEPDKWAANAVHPLEKRRLEKEARDAQIVADLRNRTERKIAIANEPARESVEDLARQGVYVTQIAKMHKIRPDQVLAELKEKGIEAPAWDRAADMAKATKPVHPEGDVGDARRRIDEAASRPIRHTPKPAADEYEPENDVDQLAGGELIDEEPADVDALGELNASNDEASQLGEQLGGLTIEQEIITLHLDGGEDADVAEAVGQKIGKVRAVLKEWKKNPEKFGIEGP